MEPSGIESFDIIYNLIVDKNMPINYVHTKKSRTALGITAEKGFDDALIKLLNFGANPSFIDKYGKTAFDYARENRHEVCCDVLSNYPRYENGDSEAQAKQFKLLAYKMTSGLSNTIDHELLLHVLEHIHTQKPINDSILVFLPGYSDIMEQYDLIERHFIMTNYKLYVLHSSVNGASNVEQSKVFDSMTAGIRKIILSTNIAETSLTINDVVSSDIRYIYLF